MSTLRPTRTDRAAAALSGLLAAGAGIAVGSGVAALIEGTVSPFVAVGNRFIDWTPSWLKDFAIDQFGTNDKPVLLASMAVVIAIVAAVAGFLGWRRPAIAVGAAIGLGVVAVAASATDRTALAAPVLNIVPALVTAVVAIAAMIWLLSVVRGSHGASGAHDEAAYAEPAHGTEHGDAAADTPTDVTPPALHSHPDDELPDGFDRRKFLVAVGATGAVIVVGAGATRLAGEPEAVASRAGLTIPSPDVSAAAIPDGVQVDVPGIPKWITPNSDFYRIDTALQVPDVPADTWTLRIHGMVDNEIEINFAELLDRRLVERRITLTCVSNPVGGGYVGNATWIGVPLRELLAEAGVSSDADALRTTSADGWTAGTPIEAATDPDRDALVAFAMNGEPLPLEHGFPVRLVIPGLYGYVSATKWLTEIEVTRFDDFTAYWTDRGWGEEGPIKTQSRIDVPRGFGELKADAAVFGGTAWAQHTGIELVEVSIDNGDWVEADLGTEDSIETWRQWRYEWADAEPGTHNIQVRATDKSGYTQTSDEVGTVPDGATGWHSIQFTVGD